MPSFTIALDFRYVTLTLFRRISLYFDCRLRRLRRVDAFMLIEMRDIFRANITPG